MVPGKADVFSPYLNGNSNGNVNLNVNEVNIANPNYGSAVLVPGLLEQIAR